MRLRTGTLLALGALTVLAGAAIAPSLPAIAELHADTPDAPLLARLVLTATALSIALTAPLAGRAVDRWGGRAVLVVALAGYGLVGTAGLWLDGLHALLGARIGFGVMVGAVMSATNALIAGTFQGAQRQQVLGWQAVATGLSGLLFLTLGGLLAQWHWRGPFAIYAVAWLLLPLVLMALPRHAPRAASERIASGDGALRRLRWVLAAALATSIAFYLMPTQAPFLLHDLGVRHSGMVGLAVGLATLASALASLGYRRLRAHLGPTAVFAAGFGLVGAGYAISGIAGELPLAVAGLAIAGAGVGWLMPHLMVTGLEAVAPHQHGAAAGWLTSALFLGQFLSPLVTQPIVADTDVATGFLGIAAAAAFIAVALLCRPLVAAASDRH